MGIVSPIIQLFGKSPIGPIQRHMAKSCEAAIKLQEFLNEALEENWPQAAKLNLKIRKLEEEADDIKREIRLNLPSSLFLPIARADLLQILNIQDKIANKSKDISGIIMGRKILIPSKLHSTFKKYIKTSIDAAKQAHKAISELDELFSTGFRGKEIKLIKDMIVKLDKIENSSDDQKAAILNKLFSIESELNPVEIIFLYKLVEWIAELADRAQVLGGLIQLTIAK